MDELGKRLQKDAGRIRAEVSGELCERIDASLAAARTRRPVRRAEHRFYPLWLAASLTGAAATLGAIAVMNWPVANDSQPFPAGEEIRSVPEYVHEIGRDLPLRARTADLTAPLETELENLRSDLERARENVERDLRFSF